MQEYYDGVRYRKNYPKEILLTNDGDFMLGPDGDIATIDNGSLLVQAQDICILLERTFSHTEEDSGLIGANLSIFNGKPISDELIKNIEEIIENIIKLNTAATDVNFLKTKVINNTLLIAIEILFNGEEKLKIILTSSPSHTYATSFN